MQDLELYQYQRSNGGRGHVSGTSEDDARQRLAKRGLGDVSEITALEDEQETPGWPPTAQEQLQYQQLMQTPDFY
jgi:hypothetical protein